MNESADFSSINESTTGNAATNIGSFVRSQPDQKKKKLFKRKKSSFIGKRSKQRTTSHTRSPPPLSNDQSSLTSSTTAADATNSLSFQQYSSITANHNNSIHSTPSSVSIPTTTITLSSSLSKHSNPTSQELLNKIII